MTKAKIKVSNVEEAIAKGFMGLNGQLFADKLIVELPNLDEIMPNSKFNGGSVQYAKLVHANGFTIVNDPEVVGNSLQKKFGYRLAFQVKLEHSDEQPCVWLLQRNPPCNLIRLEFTPSKLSELAKRELAVFMETFVEDFWKLLFNFGYTRRVDAAVDLWNVKPEQVWAVHNHTLSTFGVARNGTIQTLTFGSQKGVQSTIYDKTAQLKLANSVPVTRIEQKWCGKILLRKLHELENPFNNFAVLATEPPKPEWAKSWDWTQFLCTSKVLGSMGAMTNLPYHSRTKYRNHIEANSTKYWKPSELWDDWPKIALSIQSGGKYLDICDQPALPLAA